MIAHIRTVHPIITSALEQAAAAAAAAALHGAISNLSVRVIDKSE